MALAPQTRLGPYVISALIGQGGMGEVYKAIDTRLDRTVAVKVLPAHVASDPELKQRFEREAKALAALSHPHICPVFDVGNQDGVDFLVMEYLEGETLEQRLKKGLLPLEQALQIAVQISEGLAAAHRAGVIHRDLKPGNIMLTKAGAKLLDFGLAMVRPVGGPITALSAGPTVGSPLTGAGSILGTFQYMAPEQLEGQKADQRTDIFAFGAVVYEMVTGTRAFEGKAQASLIGAILKDEPLPASKRQPLTPSVLDHIIQRCLAKDPDQRWQSASDLMRELKWVAENRASLGGAPATVAGVGSPAYRSWFRPLRVALAAAAACAAATGITFTYLSRNSASDLSVNQVTQFEASPPPGVVLGPPLAQHALAWSPDGRQLVYVANGTIYRRRLGEVDATPVRGIDTTSWVRTPFFSPDGRWIGFFQSGQIRRVPADGGAVVDLCDASSPFGAVWGEDNTIVYGQGGNGIWQVPAGGGEPAVLVKARAGEILHGPQRLDGDEWVLLTVLPVEALQRGWDEADIVVESLRTAERRTILRGASDARYVSSGHLLYLSGGTLFGVAFDRRRLTAVGTPVPLVEDVLSGGTLTGAAQFAFSAQGTLAYVHGNRSNKVVMRVNRTGAEEAQLTPEPGNYSLPRVAPDGQRAIVAAGRTSLIVDLTKGGATSLITDASYAGNAVEWSPDGQAVVSVVGNPRSLIFSSVNGSDVRTLVPAKSRDVFALAAQSFTPDGQSLVFSHQGERNSRDVSLVSLLGPDEVRPLLHTRFNELNAQISPDGRWIAYQSDESGRYQIYVRPFPDAESDRWLISPDEGRTPAWARDSRELFYLAPGNQLMAVPIMSGQDHQLLTGPPVRLFEARYYGGFFEGGSAENNRHFDVTPDGRFLMIKTLPSEANSMRIIVVQNWLEELKRLATTD